MSMVDELNIQISADVGGASASISGVAQSLEDLGGSAGNAKGDMSDFVAVMSGIAQQMQQFTATIAQAVSGLTSFGGSTADLDRFAVASERASTSLTSMSDAAIYTSPRIGMMGTAAEQTRSELQGMQQGLQGALSDIKSFSDNLGNAGKDAADAAEKIKKLSEELPKLKTAPVTNLEAAFKKLKGTVAALGIGKFLKDSNDAYVVQMQNELKLTAHMKQRMNATDEEVAAIKRLASAQQKIGVIGDEIQLAGAQQLTTYAKQSSTLRTLIPAMNDLIAQNAGYEASTGDAISMADALGRALNGQYTSLKRMGVSFTEAQVQVLKYGTESQKAAVLAEAIGDKVGNINELLANTPTGKLKQLQNDFGDLREQIGATFQPLISSIVPVLGGLMDALREPIKALARGITIIGQAIAAIDSPATRAIGLAVAAGVAISKLKAALGGTYAALVLVGTALTMLIGGSKREQNEIEEIVTSAFGSAEKATDDAADAAKRYEEQINGVQKATAKLAGFDTITKLSGGSTGSLASALLGDDDLSKIYEFTDAAEAAKKAASDIDAKPQLDTSDIVNGIKTVQEEAFKFGANLEKVFSNWGDDEKVYEPLTKLTNTIEGILNAVGLDGTGFVDFWKGVGDDIYKAMTNQESGIYKGLKDWDAEMRKYLPGWKEWSDFWQNIGVSMQKRDSGQYDTMTEKLMDSSWALARGIANNPDGGIVQSIKFLADMHQFNTQVSKTVGDFTSLSDNELAKLLIASPTPQPNNNYAAPAARSTADVPSEARGYINVEVKNYINDEQVNSDYTTRTNG